MKRPPITRKAPLKRQAVKRKPKRNPCPADTVAVVLRRDNYTCQAAAYGWPTEQPCDQHSVQIHHKRGRGLGGSSDPNIHDPALLVCLCPTHHAEVESRRTDAYACGLAERRNT